MARTMIVTGAASGIGQTTAQLLRDRGDSVIGVDLRDADVNVDLSTSEGRTSLVDQVRDLSDRRIDGILAVAGVYLPIPTTVAVNFFGMVATLEGLRPLLTGSDAPRAVGTASIASVHPVDEELCALMAAGDEPGALARAEELASDPATAGSIYPSSKRAFAHWVRRTAPSEEWAAAGIPLNAIAPGVITTPMSASLMASEEGRERLAAGSPMPLGGFAEPIVPARMLAWLVSEENTHLCGQVIFVMAAAMRSSGATQPGSPANVPCCP